MHYLKRFLGLVSLTFGLALIGWFVYNVFSPTHEFKAHDRSVFQLFLPAALILAGWRWLRDDGPGLESQTVDFTAPELLNAAAEARRTLPRFLEAVRRNTDQAYIKFPLMTDAGVTEHVWAYVHHFDGNVFNASVVNTLATGTQSPPPRRDVALSEVEDWQIMAPDGAITGGYSMIGAFRYLDRKGVPMNRTMRRQRAQLVDA